MSNSILSVAPLRISFVGGGTDFPSFYQRFEGAVVSAAIKKYVYVHIKQHDSSFQEKYRIAYSEVERTNSRESIRNDIVRLSLEFLDIDSPLQISTSSDLPSGSGLGSSSSFTIALLLGLHALKGTSPTTHELAEQACHIEMNLLKKPIGKQDQYAAAFGGINLFRFQPDEKVRVEPVLISAATLMNILASSKLFWTGRTRSVDEILHDQALNSQRNTESLLELHRLALKFRDVLEESSCNLLDVADLIERGWILKQTLSSRITDVSLIEQVEILKNKYGNGVKLLGAGGGGFIYALNTRGTKSNEEYETLANSLSIEIDYQGARILSGNRFF